METDVAAPSARNPLVGENTDKKSMVKTDLGLKTGTVDTDLESVINKVSKQRNRLSELSLKVNQFLSKNQFVN